MFSSEAFVKWLKWLLGMVILVYLFFVLKEHFTQDLNFRNFPSGSTLNWWALALVLLLMPVNWGLETLKWKRLMGRIGEFSFGESFRCTLAGTSTAIFTPNRLGDVAGRMVLVPDHQRKDAFWATVLCNLSQLAALLILGIPGLFLFIQLWPEKGLNFSDTTVFFTSGFITVVAVIAYYYASNIIPLFIKLMPFKSWRKYLKKTLNVLMRASTADLHVLLLLSVLRILTYAFQYFLTIYFFDVNLGFLETVASILSVYLLKTVVPYLPATGLLVRTELSLWVFSAFTEELVLILAASFTIWTINVVIPAIWGYFLILTADLKGKS